MSLSVGIVGLPNVGKSTLFNALLKKQAALAANYPFATIEPNTGVVPVPDERLSVLAQIVGTTTIKPATVEFVDIAGLVKGASTGEGLGNQFLAHIREVQVIAHVVRAFTDTQVLREGSVDPVSDRETIETELLLADLATLEKQKKPKGVTDRAVLERWSVVERLLAATGAGTQLRHVVQSELEQQVARELGLLTAKPVLYVVNVDESALTAHRTVQADQATALGVDPTDVVVVSAKIESELAELDAADAQSLLAELGLEQSGLERVITAAYHRLQLQSFLTAGEKEVRAWTIRAGTTAPEAAGVIHTDFAKKFIKAKVANYDDFVTHQGWKGLREAGKVRLEGRDYQMRPDDIVEFMIGS